MTEYSREESIYVVPPLDLEEVFTEKCFRINIRGELKVSPDQLVALGLTATPKLQYILSLYTGRRQEVLSPRKRTRESEQRCGVLAFQPPQAISHDTQNTISSRNGSWSCPCNYGVSSRSTIGGRAGMSQICPRFERERPENILARGLI